MRYCLIVLSLFFGLSANAQLCNGSLGEPVVNINFGNKNSAAGPLRPGVTNLGYVTGCPLDGNYSIVNAAFGCFGSSWHDIPRDHTGDEEGRFMLINATNAPSVFYVDTIAGLCGNTSYEFGAWVANVLKQSSCSGSGTKPNLTFTIETLSGAVLQSYTTGPLLEEANLTFRQYGFLFKPDINTTTIVLRIANNAGAGCGNDLAIDDITFRPCGPVMSANIDGEAGFNKNICSNNQTIMTLGMTVGPGYINPVYQWQISTDLGNTWRDIAGATNTSYIRNGTNVGTYQYRLLAGESVFATIPTCRTASSPITIKINNAAPKIGNQFINQCIGGTINLAGASGSGGGLSYLWTGPNGFTSTIRNPVLPNIKSGDTGRYIVQVSTTEGCTASDTISITAFNAINGSFSGNTVICLGDSTVLTAIGGSQFEWYNQTRAPIGTTASLLVKPFDTTTYQLLLRDGAGCADSINIPLYVIKPPLVDAGPNRTIMQGNSIALLGTISGQNSGFVWSPTTNMQQQNTLTPLVSPLNTTTYSLTGYGLNGCAASQDTVQVRVFVSIAPPNSFSPNGDGVHDIWLVPGLETYPNATLSIFNRDGQILYQAKPYFEGWDGTYKGKQVPIGVYYYIINRGNGEALLSGSIYLIR